MDARVTQAATDAERYPTLSAAGMAMLRRLREHPAAPRFHNRSGKQIAVNNAVLFLARDRELAEDAYAGDIIAP